MRQRVAVNRTVFLSLLVLSVLFASAAGLAQEIEWTSIGPGGGGPIFAGAIHPEDVDIALMGSDCGGILRTENGGASWELVNNAIAAPDGRAGSYDVGDLEFALTKKDGEDFYSAYAGAYGLYTSDDSGQTWREVFPSSLSRIDTLVVHPADPDVVYAGGRYHGSVFRFEVVGEGLDTCTRSCVGQLAGESCEQLCDVAPSGEGGRPAIRSLVIDPEDVSHFLACTNAGIWESLDGAQTWSKLPANGLPLADTDPESSVVLEVVCRQMEAHPNGALYATFETTMTVGGIEAQPFEGTPDGWPGTNPPTDLWMEIDTWNGGVYKSTDFGANWVAANGTESPTEALPNPGFEDDTNSDGHADDWGYYPPDTVSVSRDGDVKHSGAYSIKIDNPGTESHGVYADIQIGGEHRGRLFDLTVWIKASHGDEGTTQARLVWYDSFGAPLYWPGEFRPATFWVDLGSEQFPNFDWRKYHRLVRIPDGAHSARLYLRASDSSGQAWFDDVSLRQVYTLPRNAYQGNRPWIVGYSEIAVDPTDPVGGEGTETVYVATPRGAFMNTYAGADTGGVWKTTDGGAQWKHVTRIHYWDNVEDGRETDPVCGDGVCEGRWETFETCPGDCGLQCGDGNCDDGLGETMYTCLVDCPEHVDDTHEFWDMFSQRNYYEVDGYKRPDYENWMLTIGRTEATSQTLYAVRLLKTDDGGGKWVDVTGSLIEGGSTPAGSWSARGDINPVYVHPVATHSAEPDRLYYGDDDEHFQVSYDGGLSFVLEGNYSWYYDVGLSAAGVFSIVVDPVDPNHVFLGLGDKDAGCSDDRGGIVEGVVDCDAQQNICTWQWSPLGIQTSEQKGSSDLVLHGDDFFVAVYGKGVYRLPNGYTAADPSVLSWERVWIGDPPSNCEDDAENYLLNTYRLVSEPTSGRLYVGVGFPYAYSGVDPDHTGVWMSQDRGDSWTKISDPQMEGEPIVELLPLGPDVLFAGTWFAYGSHDVDSSGNWIGDGGLYRGVESGGEWAWTQVLPQPKVSGIAVSPQNSSILYAYVAQARSDSYIYPAYEGQEAGIYKSLDEGQTWERLPDSSPMNLKHARLFFNINDSLELFAATNGGGLFEGAISCTDVNDVCDLMEECISCPDDCPRCPDDCVFLYCGNGICEPFEDCDTCPADCREVKGPNPVCCSGCNDTRCSRAGWACTNDLNDVDRCCGDGECEAPENEMNCAVDCGS